MGRNECVSLLAGWIKKKEYVEESTMEEFSESVSDVEILTMEVEWEEEEEDELMCDVSTA